MQSKGNKKNQNDQLEMTGLNDLLFKKSVRRGGGIQDSVAGVGEICCRRVYRTEPRQSVHGTVVGGGGGGISLHGTVIS